MTNATVHGHRHAEAYCRMLYRDLAGNEEWIWNSRDGVTPFITTSRQGLEATHQDWERDEYLPDYEPKVGERIWVDLTEDVARQRATDYVAKWWPQLHFGIEGNAVFKTEEEAVQSFTKSWYDDGVRPTLVEVTEEVQKELRLKRLEPLKERILRECPLLSYSNPDELDTDRFGLVFQTPAGEYVTVKDAAEAERVIERYMEWAPKQEGSGS